MKYFIDTEFIEGFHTPFLGKRRHFIDLISIGIVAEDGRELELISNRYSYNDADEWIKKNVIIPLYTHTVHGDQRNHIDADNFQKFFGWSNSIIASKIIDFVGQDCKPEFYAYYADYDWVVFCSLFGRMIDLPKYFPMYCRDLKQMLDEKVEQNTVDGKFQLTYPYEVNGEEVSICGIFESIKDVGTYPIQENEHSALDDAKWNKKLFDFLKGL